MHVRFSPVLAFWLLSLTAACASLTLSPGSPSLLEQQSLAINSLSEALEGNQTRAGGWITVAARPAAAKGKESSSEDPPQSFGWRVVDFRGLAYVDIRDVARFFSFDSVKRTGKQVALSRKAPPTQWEMQVGSKLVSLNRLKLYLSYPVVSFQGDRTLLSAFDLMHVIDPILRPDQQREPTELKTVIIDPARGGSESGVVTKFGREKDVTLDIARRLKPLLEAAGYRVVLTREGDESVSLPERLKAANAVREEAVFLSLHASYGSSREKGVETFTLSPCGTPSTTGDEGTTPDQKFYPGNVNDRESMALATAVQGMLVHAAGAEDLGIRRARFGELKGVEVPAVVCSVGRLAHPQEGARLAGDPAHRQQIAEGIAQGVQRYARVMAAGSPPKDRMLKFAKVEVFPDRLRHPAGEQVRVRATIAKTAKDASIDPSQLILQVYFLDVVNDEEIDLSTCDTPEARWISVIPNWVDADFEQVEFTYLQPPFTQEMVQALGRRHYYGFVLRLVYGDQLLDEYAEPANLRRGLSTFTAVTPRR